MDSRTDAVGLYAKAITIADALEKIASSSHGTVMRLRLRARARLGACARFANVVAAARPLVPCAHTMANARAASSEVSRSIWLTALPREIAIR